jgi:homoserine dehydrogenase
MSGSKQGAALRVAIAGLGTVGAGLVDILQRQGALIAERAGRPIEIRAISARRRDAERPVDLSAYEWWADPAAMAREADVDVVVEVIGGSDGVARQVAEAALKAGRRLVTANKALLAVHGSALAEMAESRGLSIGFEAAVAGGIPIIKALREGLAANGLTRVVGILNGTCNYILTTMRETGRAFDDVLADAQRLGYAEADPSFDVDGIDAAHKLAILASVAFGAQVDFGHVYIEGIRKVAPVDIAYAAELGYRIKLLGMAELTEHGLEQRVHPCMVPLSSPIAHVEGVFNAVVAQGDAVGMSFYQGRGAGAGPTGSAVIADLVDIARGHSLPTFSVPYDRLNKLAPAPIERHRGPYFIRLTVRDQPGVIAAVAAALRDEDVSMEAFLQRGRDPNEAVQVVLTTHDTSEASMRRALAQIAKYDSVLEPPHLIRIIQDI